jgi:hypothetical protein
MTCAPENEERALNSTKKSLAMVLIALAGVSAFGCSQTPTVASAEASSRGLQLVLKAQNISASCVKLLTFTAALERQAPTIYEQVAPGYRLVGLELMWPTTLIGWNLAGEDRRNTVIADGMKYTYTTLEKPSTHERGLVVYAFPVVAAAGEPNDVQTVDVYNCGQAK